MGNNESTELYALKLSHKYEANMRGKTLKICTIICINNLYQIHKH